MASRKMRKWRNKHYRRWLNPKTSDDTGAVQASVVIDGFYDNKKKWCSYNAASISIWDCYKKIDLNFNWADSAEATTRIAKLNSLIEIFEKVKADIIEGQAYCEYKKQETDNGD